MYRIEKADLGGEQIRNCAQFLASAYDNSALFTPEYIDWQYRQNPLGKAIAFNAYDEGGSLVGHYALQPFDVLLMGEKVRGLLAINGAVSRDVRGQNLFPLIVKTTEEDAKSSGFLFKIGVSNQNSTPVLIEKTGFRLICPLPAMLGIGSLKFETKERELDYIPVWNRDSLNWRIRNPSYRYRLVNKGSYTEVQVYTGLTGIIAVVGRFDSKLFDLPGAKGFFTPNPLHLVIGLDSRFQWKKSLYFNIPLRLRPSPLNLIFKDISGSGIRLEPGRMRFNAIDFDAF